MHRSPPSSKPAAQPAARPPSVRIAETVFLLSIARDEDDAAAIRADLKRSLLGDYKLQHCARLDDAESLLRVCSFDAAIARLDDFHDPAAAAARLRALDPELPIVGLAGARALSRPDFKTPPEIDSLIRAEDLSPSLLELAVRSTLAKRREARERLALRQELELALEAGQLGRWAYEPEDDALELDAAAAALLGVSPESAALPLDKALENAEPESKAALRAAFLAAAKSASPIASALAVRPPSSDANRLELFGRAQKRPRGAPARLLGVVRRADESAEARERVEQARAVLEEALRGSESALERARAQLADLASAPSAASKAPPNSADAAASERAPAARDAHGESEAASPSGDANGEAPNRYEPPASARDSAADSDGLGIDTQAAFQSVLRSLARQRPGDDGNPRSVAFPFDFSADSALDYTEPDPAAEGFVGAAKRLVSITQRGHGLRVSMSVDEPAAIEAEAEKHLIFDILRELLTNVVKHAKATLCIISLFRDEDEWVLQVEDDGLGLEKSLVSVSTPLNQIGLFRIRTQLALKGGHLDIAPSAPTGLVARARLPVTLRRGQSRAEAERA